MKNRKSVLICIAVMLIVPAASMWAVWEGNAGIAAASEFPGSGLYARSDMFPKNTIVEIENLETEITIRAVITGSAGIPGLVAVLSPNTAAALNISPGSVSRVRISIPAPVAEKPAAGTVPAPNATETADPDVNPAMAANDAAALKSVTDRSEDPLVPLSSATAESPAVTATVAETAPAVVPPVVPVAVVADDAEAESAARAAEESATSEDTPAIADESEDAGTEESLAAATDEESDETESVADAPESSSEPEIAVKPAAVGDTSASGSSISEEPAVAAESPAEVEDSSAPVVAASDAVPVPEETASSSAVYDEPSITESPPSAPAEVTLVPTDENPPAPTESAVAVDVPVAEPVMAETVAAPAVESVAVPAPVAIAPSVPEVKTPAEESAPSLPFITSLDKGSFYIQIATCAELANVKKIVDTYGKKYPISVERGSGKKGDAVKVYIGPVRKDEYGAVLERFRQLGYKDAFVKKGQ